jgi:Tfp pilus assembly protein PilW
MINRRLPHQRGLSLLEFLVAQALGMVVVGAALSAWAGTLATQTRAQTRIQSEQALQAAGEHIAGLLRRAGYAEAPAASGSAGEPAGDLSGGSTCSPTPPLQFHQDGSVSFRTDADSGPTAIRLKAAALQIKLGAGHWQSLTDPATLSVQSLRFEPASSTQASNACGASTGLRAVAIHMTAEPSAALTKGQTLRWSRWVHLPNGS